MDINNYNCHYNEFKNNFLDCNNSPLKISQNLKDLLDSLNIKISDNPDEISKTFYISQKFSKFKENEYPKTLQHKRGAFHYSPELKIKSQKQMKEIIELLKTVKKE